MNPTLLLYLCLCVALLGTTVFLVLRDMRAARAGAVAAPLGVRLLPTPLPESFRGAVTDRIDWGFRRLIYQTGLDITAEPAFLLQVLCGLTLGGTLFVANDDLLQGVIGMVLGMGVPLGAYFAIRARRLRAFRDQLPEAMDLMARAVRAGETLDQAIEQVGHSTPAPLGLEFERCAKQMELGLSLPAAMRALMARAPLTEVRILAATFNVQRRSGGNLAITLDRLAGVVRDRISYQRHFMAATGASRIATLLVAVAGPAVFSYMMFFQRDYVGQFFELPGGTMLLSTACVLQLVGLIWVGGLLRNKY